MLLLRIVLLILALSPAAPASDEAATVKFEVFAADGVGRPQYRVHEFYNMARKLDYSSHFVRDMRSRRVPFGSYQYTLIRLDAKKPNATTIKGRVTIYQLRQRITLVAPANVAIDNEGNESIMDGVLENNKLTGKYVGLSHRRPTELWVRLYNPISGASSEVELDGKDGFSFAGCPPGKNVLLLMEGNSVLQIDTIASDPPFGREITTTLVRR